MLAAKEGEDSASHRALSELCQSYWYPLYAHARRADTKPADAEDITQAFLESLIKRNVFARVTPGGGRLRSYLLKSMNHFLASDLRNRTALKRGGGQALISIDQEMAEERYQFEPKGTEDPELLYERRWATLLLENVLAALKQESEAKNKTSEFEALHPLLTPGAAEVSHREIGEKLGVSESAARIALYRMRQRYGDLLRATISDTVVSEEDVADEISHLMKVFGARSN